MKFGEAEADTFEEACIKVCKGNPLCKDYWEESNPTVCWGCLLVSSQEEALELLPEDRRESMRN